MSLTMIAFVVVAVVASSASLATAAVYGDKTNSGGEQGPLFAKNKAHNFECIRKEKPIQMIEVKEKKGTRAHTRTLHPIMANIRPGISGYCLHDCTHWHGGVVRLHGIDRLSVRPSHEPPSCVCVSVSRKCTVRNIAFANCCWWWCVSSFILLPYDSLDTYNNDTYAHTFMCTL